MTGRRVVITGIGMISARVTEQGAVVSGFDPRAHFRIPKALKLTDRTTQFAVSAAAMALEQAAWPTGEAMNDRLGVIIGVSGSDLQAEDLARALRSDGAPVPVNDIPVFADRILSGLNPLWLLVNLPNMPSAHVAIQLGARGPNSTVMTDWVAGSQAIGEAADWIRAGEADAVLAGGADCALTPFALAAYEQAGLLPRTPTGRRVLVPSEGAAVLLLEEREQALGRGATVLGEITGYASASSPVGAERSALERTMAASMREAQWQPSDIAAVALASAEGTPLRAREVAALERALGARASSIAVADFQARVGHAAAALGPLSLCLLLGTASGPGGLLANTAGYSGQAVSLAVLPGAGSGAAS